VCLRSSSSSSKNGARVLRWTVSLQHSLPPPISLSKRQVLQLFYLLLFCRYFLNAWRDWNSFSRIPKDSCTHAATAAGVFCALETNMIHLNSRVSLLLLIVALLCSDAEDCNSAARSTASLHILAAKGGKLQVVAYILQ
jgi:hypothetical protein